MTPSSRFFQPTHWLAVLFTFLSLATLPLAQVGAMADLSSPPVITQNLSGTEGTTSSTITITIVATGNPAPDYQWYHDGIAIPDATNATYVITNATPADSGEYYVIVSNTLGSVTSGIRKIDVMLQNVQPYITKQPVSQTVDEGSDAVFKVTIALDLSSTTSTKYQWYRGEKAVAGATGATFTLAKVTAKDAGSYHVHITNNHGTVESTPAELTVTAITKPKFTRQPPKTLETALGQRVTIETEAVGYPAPSYQWLLHGFPIPGATAATLDLPSITADYIGHPITVVAYNAKGSTTSSAVRISAVLPPQITTPAATAPIVAFAAKGAKLSVKTASNRAKATYQWLLDGTEISGATAATYTAKTDGTYSVRVTNAAGSDLHTFGAVTLIAPPQIATFTASATSILDGESVTFAVALKDGTGTPPLSYTWLRDGKPIADAPTNSPTYTATNIVKNGTYGVTVTNGTGKVVGKAKSKAVKIKVTTRARITDQTAALTIVPGKSGKLSVTATGTAKLTYQWFKDDIPVFKATSRTLTLKKASYLEEGTYTVVVNNGANIPVTSAPIVVTVQQSSSAASSLSYSGGSSVSVGGAYLSGSYGSVSIANITDLTEYSGSASFVLSSGGTLTLGQSGGYGTEDLTPASSLGTPETLNEGDHFGFRGVIEDTLSGTQLETSELGILASQKLPDGDFTYTKTGHYTATLAYTVSRYVGEVLREETGEIQFRIEKFTVAPETGGIFSFDVGQLRSSSGFLLLPDDGYFFTGHYYRTATYKETAGDGTVREGEYIGEGSFNYVPAPTTPTTPPEE